MKGEFKGDFSRDTFNPSKHFLRVLMQQGRVSLDADWNEQVDILLHYMQTLAKDIIGPFAGPADDLGFKITPTEDFSFDIGPGRYYVDGVLCEIGKKDVSCGDAEESKIGYYNQMDYPITKSADPLTNYLLVKNDPPLLVYMDVWERHISYVEDDEIREKALGRADTASRSKVVWQVKVRKISDELEHRGGPCKNIRDGWIEIVETLQPSRRGCLKARANRPADEDDPCITPPKARYRGLENQLYRVEIHRGGIASEGGNASEGGATFKWSRDNGSVIFPIDKITDDNEITLEPMRLDNKLGLKVGDWVEVVDDAYTLLIQSRPSPLTGPRHLAQVDEVDLAEMKVTLALKPNDGLPNFADIKDRHPFLRRWDYKEPNPTKQGEPKFVDDGFSGLLVEEGGCNEDDGWLTLEDGVQICFLLSSDEKRYQNVYQPGDYWLIPARTATEDVEWPRDEDDHPKALPPHGINHHYAPLAVVLENWADTKDCRCKITYTCNPP